MKRRFVLLAIAAQALVPGWMVAEREMIVQSGQVIQLRTAPVDPRDIFRGDFVRLDYEISTLGREHLSDELRDRGIRKGDILYTHLRIGTDGLARADTVSREPAAAGPSLRARAPRDWQPTARHEAIHLRYGIEKYFVEQGKGRAMEQRRGQRQGLQVPLLMQVAVGNSAKGVLIGHRWSALGGALQVLRGGAANALAGNRNALLEYRLENVSEQPLTLVFEPNQCALHLEPVIGAARQPRPRRSRCGPFSADQLTVVTLAPRQSRRFRIDLDAPRWRVPLEGKQVGIGELEWNQRYRIVYRAPALDSPTSADQPPRWQGELPSRAFHGRGAID